MYGNKSRFLRPSGCVGLIRCNTAEATAVGVPLRVTVAAAYPQSTSTVYSKCSSLSSIVSYVAGQEEFGCVALIIDVSFKF